MLKFNKIFSRKDLVSRPSSAWDRDSVEVVTDNCTFFTQPEIDDIEDCQIFFEGSDDAEQTLFWESAE